MPHLSDNSFPRISPREAQTLLGMIEGKTYAEISNDMKIGLEGVRTHVRRLRDKLQMRRKRMLAIWATKNLIEIQRIAEREV